MTLADAGPLVAFLDQADPHHQLAIREFAVLSRGGAVTTWPCFTEAMHLLGRGRRADIQGQLWRLVFAGALTIRDSTPPEVRRMEALMRAYANVPMDLADASIVAAAEVLGLDRVFSFDSDFRIYQLADGSYLDIVP